MFQLPKDFRLHETTRRRVFLAAFVGFCLVPTAGVLAWGVGRMLPGHAREEAGRLGRVLGLRADVDKVRHPRPGVVVYEGVRLSDPDSGQALLGTARVTAEWSNSAGPNAACTESLDLAVEGLQTDVAAAPRLCAVVLRALGPHPDWPPIEVRLVAPDARLSSGGSLRNLTEVKGFLQPIQGGRHGQISFRVAGIESESPISVRFGRNHKDTPAQTGMELSTGGGIFPCALLAPSLPALAHLGPRAGVQGVLGINEQGGRVEHRLVGQLTGVDLKTLMGDRLAHTLTGTARVQVDHARVSDGRLEEAAGSVWAGPGMAGRALLDAAVEDLGLVRGVEPDDDADPVPYEQLAFVVQIGPEGLRIRGACPVPGPGSVMVDPHSRLLAEPDARSQPAPVGALVRMLASRGGTGVPATRQAEWLMRLLPLPQGTEGP